jgi:hypothetical protein
MHCALRCSEPVRVLNYPRGAEGAELAVLAQLIKGVRDAARRARVPPLSGPWPGHGRFLALAHGRDGTELACAVARDAGWRLRRVGGVPALVTSDGRTLRVPSRSAALALVELVREHTDFVIGDRDIRRTLAILATRVAAHRGEVAA